jgi:glycosidase
MPCRPPTLRLLALSCLAALLTGVAAADPVVRLTDPEGDDHGDGNLVYPSQGFAPGDLDLVSFTVENDGDETVFTVEFEDRIKQPQRGARDELGTDFTKIARHGFYQFNVDIYIDTDRRPGSGFTRLMPGRLAAAAPDHAWDVAVLGVPRPTIVGSVLRDAVQAEEEAFAELGVPGADAEQARALAASIDRATYLPRDLRVRGRRLELRVPQAVLGGPAQATWGYTVIVTGADLQASLELMSATGLASATNTALGALPISPGEEWTNRFGGGRHGQPLQPPIVDMFVPDGVTQEALLSDYDSSRGRRAVLPAVVPAGAGRPAGEGAAEGGEVPTWALAPWDGRVCYEIFVRSFQDSDGDGIGDLQGLISRLDYLNDGDPTTDTDLGIEAIWLMPVFASPSYHGYDAIDYYRINPDYGTEADFDALVAECRRRGIAVVLDLMLNHTSSQHPWFVASARDPQGDKRDWYVWREENPGWTQPWGSGPSWHERNGAYYYGIFWSGMPDLNWRNPEVREEARAISRFWLDRGVAGFRLDAAKHLVATGPGEQQNDAPESHQYWREYSEFLRTEYPDRLMLGEIWSSPDAIAPYYGDAQTVPGGDEFAMTFNFTLAGGIIQTVNLGDAGPLTSALARIAAAYPDGVLDGTFLANHDMTRLATQLGGNVAKQGQAAAILLTLPGTPWLYYGEEVGLRNGTISGDEAKRTPMPWADDDTAFTTGVPWFRFAPGRETASVAAQTDDPQSLLSRYRTLIRLRQQHPALRTGDLALVALEGAPTGAVAYLRTAGDQRLLVVHNLADAPATLAWTLPGEPTYTLRFGDRGVGVPAGGAITLPARATGVWELDAEGGE